MVVSRISGVLHFLSPHRVVILLVVLFNQPTYTLPLYLLIYLFTTYSLIVLTISLWSSRCVLPCLYVLQMPSGALTYRFTSERTTVLNGYLDCPAATLLPPQLPVGLYTAPGCSPSYITTAFFATNLYYYSQVRVKGLLTLCSLSSCFWLITINH